MVWQPLEKVSAQAVFTSYSFQASPTQTFEAMLCAFAGSVQVKVASLVDSVQQLSRTPGFSAMLKDIDMSNTVRQLWEKVSMDSALLDSALLDNSQLQSASGSCRLQARQAAALLMFMCGVVSVYVHLTQVPCSTHASDAWRQCAKAVTLSSSRPVVPMY